MFYIKFLIIMKYFIIYILISSMAEQNTSNILIQVRPLDKNYNNICILYYYFSLYSSMVERNTVNILIDVRFILRALIEINILISLPYRRITL